jgi:hypothetical protein
MDPPHLLPATSYPIFLWQNLKLDKDQLDRKNFL